MSRARAVNSPWTDERVETLKRMLAEEATYAEIGQVLSITRNAALAKANRIGLCGCGSNEENGRRGAEKRRARAMAKRFTKRQEPRQRATSKAVVSVPRSDRPVLGRIVGAPVATVPIAVEPVHFMDSASKQCVFPLWARDQKTGMVCGAPIAFGSYCEGHARLCAPGLFEVRTRLKAPPAKDMGRDAA